jgi:uncharacterized protein (TIRG00374 family)
VSAATHPEKTGGGAPSRLRATLTFAAKIVFSLVMLGFLLTRIPAGRVADVLRQADGVLLISACGVLLLSNVLGALQWDRLMAAADIRIPFHKTLAYYHVGLFYNNFLPANIGGDIARVVDASKYVDSRAAVVSTVVLDRVIGTVALAGLAVVTTIPAITRFHFGLLYLAVVGFFAASVTLLWGVLHPRVLPALERGLSMIGFRSLKPHLDALAARFAHYRGRTRLFAGLLSLALVIQVMRVGVHILVARALHLNLPVTYFLLFVPLLAVIVSLPISFNGIGVREGAGIVLFGLIGVERTVAFTLQFTTYLVAVVVSLLGALVVLARIPLHRMRERGARRMT